MGEESFSSVGLSSEDELRPWGQGIPLVVDLGGIGEVSGVELGRSLAGRWRGVRTRGRNGIGKKQERQELPIL
jgi:hypothetical protein